MEAVKSSRSTGSSYPSAPATEEGEPIELQTLARRRRSSIRIDAVHNAALRHKVASNCENATDADEEPTPRPQAVEGEAGWISTIKTFWSSNISVVVPGEAARDHLALERTHLSYIRLATLLSLLSVTISQLQVLQHSPHPSPDFGYYVLGKPLAAALAAMAIITSVIGGLRWWRWQHALLHGRALSGGWELMFVGCMGSGIAAVLFFLALAVEIKKGLDER